MRIIIEGDKMNVEDLKEIGRFLVKFFKSRRDTIKVFVAKGTETMTAQECSKVLASMFDGEPSYKRIFYINRMGETNEQPTA